MQEVSNLEESCSLGEKIEAKQVLRAFKNGVGFAGFGGAATEKKVVRIDRIQVRDYCIGFRTWLAVYLFNLFQAEFWH